MPPYIAHLLVVTHGLWGTRSHVAYIAKSAALHATAHRPNITRSQPRPTSPTRVSRPKQLEGEEDIRLVVLCASLNEEMRTYDGIDVCAERVVEEIDQEIKRITEDGGEVRRFSIVGYSLGGLVARYVLGLLESRTPSFFEHVRPVNFSTFASPAIGIPRYKSFWSVVLRFLGARLLSRSGSQLYEQDRFLPSSLLDGNKQKKGAFSRFSFEREKAEPLLAVMADPRYSFFKALAAFEKIDIYANSVGDRTVPYPTGAIEAHDPFSLARARAKKSAAARGADPEVEPDISEGGLQVTVDEDGIITSFKDIPPIIPTTSTPPSKRAFKLSLPLLLRPTTYPFSRPVSLLIVIFLPITFPLSLVYLIISRFILPGRQSRRRIREAREASGGGREGALSRVGMRLRNAIDDVVQTVQPDNPERFVETCEDSGDESETNFAEESVLRHPSLAGFGNYGGTETPPLARPASPGRSLLAENENDTANTRVGQGRKPHHPTDPVLSDAQAIMLRNLNSLPLRKHLAFFPNARNAHGMIVARDLSYPAHHEGKKVVDSWARDFKL